MRLADESDKDAVQALQEAAYARNRELLGAEPIPLQTSIDELFEDYEIWLLEGDDGGLIGVLILQPRRDDMLLWSIAVHPDAQGRGIGKLLLQTAELRAGQFGFKIMRLYTGAALQHLIDWYGRHGYVIERTEHLDDREIVHMMKDLRATTAGGTSG